MLVLRGLAGEEDLWSTVSERTLEWGIGLTEDAIAATMHGEASGTWIRHRRTRLHIPPTNNLLHSDFDFLPVNRHRHFRNFENKLRDVPGAEALADGGFELCT